MPNGPIHPKSLQGYNELFESLYPPLCLFANKYLNNMDASKDIVQEVFIKVWEKQPSFTNHNTTKAYFYTTVKNTCINHLKSRQHKIAANAVPLDLAQYEPEEYYFAELVTAETYAQLYKAINALPRKTAKVITLSLQKYTTNEIAEELNITPSTVRTQKSMAFKKLKGFLGPLKYFLSFFLIYL